LEIKQPSQLYQKVIEIDERIKILKPEEEEEEEYKIGVSGEKVKTIFKKKGKNISSYR
jgi:predicted RNA-binding protein YlqC (UPF0109 family)